MRQYNGRLPKWFKLGQLSYRDIAKTRHTELFKQKWGLGGIITLNQILHCNED